MKTKLAFCLCGEMPNVASGKSDQRISDGRDFHIGCKAGQCDAYGLFNDTTKKEAVQKWNLFMQEKADGLLLEAYAQVLTVETVEAKMAEGVMVSSSFVRESFERAMVRAQRKYHLMVKILESCHGV